MYTSIKDSEGHKEVLDTEMFVFFKLLTWMIWLYYDETHHINKNTITIFMG